MKTLLANRLLVGIVLAVLVVGGIIWYVHGSSAPSFGTLTVARGNVIEAVDEPATVKAENSVNLSFQEAGQIAAVNVHEGDVVAQGSVLASLDRSSLEAGVEQANAALAAAQAKLDSIASGTRPEQLAIDRTAVSNAATSLAAAVNGAYTAASDAVTNQTDNLFSNPQNTNPTFLIPTTNSQVSINIVNQRIALGSELTAFYNALNASNTSPASVYAIANATLNQTQSYLDTISVAVNAATGAMISNVALAQYKTYIGTARTEVGAAVTALAIAESGYTTAEGALTLAEAGATPQDLEAQKAAVLQAQAAATAAQVAYQNAVLVAPFSGSVQNLTAQLGQVVSPSVPVLSLVNNGGLKIVTDVSETDVAKISVGDRAVVTLDAFGTGSGFPATVTTIGTTQTLVNGSPAYEVTLHFTGPQPTVKDGMTGNVHIVAAEHDGVLEVPSRLVITSGNNDFVVVPGGGGVVEKQVTIGIVGTDGNTEIVSGLNEGDTITNF